MSNQKKNILVVAAHPDDEVLGCEATIAWHVKLGDKVRVLSLGQGVMSRKDEQKKAEALKQLKADAQRANTLLGVEKLILEDFPDNTFDSVPLLNIIHTIEEEVREFKPSHIYTHHHGDVNIDHRLVSHAMQAVCRPMEDSPIEKVYAFEVPSSTEWNFSQSSQFTPNIFVNVGDGINKKVKALEAYRSEIRSFPHPRSSKYIHALATMRGGQAGFKAAEAFELVYERQ